MRFLNFLACLAVALCAPAGAATITPTSYGMDVTNGAALTRIAALAGGIIHVREGLTGTLPEDASWAVPSAVRASREAVTPITNGFATAEVRVTADPTTGAISVSDLSGNVLMADSAIPAASGSGYVLQKSIPAGAHYFGLGDKVGPMDHVGAAFTLWNTDQPLQNGDPNYKSIPYVLQLANAGQAIGLLVDDTFQQVWDFGKTTPGTLSITTNGGPVDYYVLAGPDPKSVTTRYATLTGAMPLPPLWALGYHQSRYSYQSTAEVQALAARFRYDGVPVDSIWEDIDFQQGYRPFTVDTSKFANLGGLIANLGVQQIRMVLITDLHIADAPGIGYTPYDTGASGDQFVKKSDGTVYTGNVWPSLAATPYPSVFPDFTQASTRTYWGGLYATFVGYGAAGFWNDMNEPSVFNVTPNTMPLTNVHRINSDDFATRTATHAEIHNVYGMENSRATHDGLVTLNPTERPFVLTRATYAGGQRYAATWTGDNTSSYDQLALSVSMILNMGLSGFPLVGADVGGFLVGSTPNLLTRWTEAAAFQPFMRTHSSTGTRYAEPWIDGPVHEAIRKRFISERYRLLPYFYSLAYEATQDGLPINRPIWMTYPDALTSGCSYSSAFLLGDKVLVAPAIGDAPSYSVCLPTGGWFDYWTGAAVSGTVSVSPTIGQMPVYARAGSIIPKQPAVISTSFVPKGPLQLDVYPGTGCTGSLYLDDGHSTGYQSGAYLKQPLTCALAVDGSVSLSFGSRSGSYLPWWSSIKIIVHGWTAQTSKVITAGGNVTGSVASGAATLTIPDEPSAVTLAITA